MANEAMREQWTVGAGGWVQHRELFEVELAGFADVLLDAVPITPSGRVLDVGCGTGGLLARYLAAGCTGVGVDISATMVEGAREAVPEGTFLVADAQTEDLTAHGGFTHVVSRFGVMFFDDPVAAFTNIRRSVVPGGRIGFVCWRRIEENPMFTLGTSVLQDRMDPSPPPPVPGQPGPFGLAEPGHAPSVLTEAGWVEVQAEAVDVLCDYGIAGSDGVEERLTMILGTTSGRAAQAALEPRLGQEGWAALLDEVRDELRRHLVGGRVAFDGAVWLVTAVQGGR